MLKKVTATTILGVLGFSIFMSVKPTINKIPEISTDTIEETATQEEEITHVIIVEPTTDYEVEKPSNKSPYEIAIEQMNKELSDISAIEDKYEWYKAYKSITERYIDIIETPSVYDYFSEDEIAIMCRCVETECHGKSFMAKANVASVILNRLHSGNYGLTVTKVITSPKQFAYYRTEIDESTRLAVEFVILFGDTTNGCLAFRSDSNPSKWHSWVLQFTDEGGHHFYK